MDRLRASSSQHDKRGLSEMAKSHQIDVDWQGAGGAQRRSNRDTPSMPSLAAHRALVQGLFIGLSMALYFVLYGSFLCTRKASL